MLADSSDRASSSRRDSSVMTASCTETASRDVTSAHHPVPTSSQYISPMPEWPYARDEKWVFEPSGRGTNLRSNILQRGVSAPSRLFHECLADFQSELEVGSSDTFQDGDDDLLAWVDQNLAPIGPLQTEVPAAAETRTSSCSEQFLNAQAGFHRRLSSISIPTQISSIASEVAEPIQGGGYGAVPAIQENIMDPSFDNRMASITGGQYHGTGSNSSTVTSAYSGAAADHQISFAFGSEPQPGGSGPWNSSSAASGVTFEGSMLLRGSGNNVDEPGASDWLHGSTFNVAADPAAAPGLIRHSSLPAGTGRAIRGHATHPRSIAERLRRGKITERMKRLQDLVPNIDQRQSNTADMLDDIVEYVKQLQLQVEELSQTVVQLKLKRARNAS